MSRSSSDSHEWWPPAEPPSTSMRIFTGATPLAMRTTWRIWSTVPGLNATYGMPSALSCAIKALASSNSGMPAETTTPSIGVPDARFFGTMREEPNCRFHR